MDFNRSEVMSFVSLIISLFLFFIKIVEFSDLKKFNIRIVGYYIGNDYKENYIEIINISKFPITIYCTRLYWCHRLDFFKLFKIQCTDDGSPLMYIILNPGEVKRFIFQDRNRVLIYKDDKYSLFMGYGRKLGDLERYIRVIF